jgi:hypothetical protein
MQLLNPRCENYWLRCAVAEEGAEQVVAQVVVVQVVVVQVVVVQVAADR